MVTEIEVLARQLVGALPVGTEVDVVGALTTPLPVAVIGRLLGVPVGVCLCGEDPPMAEDVLVRWNGYPRSTRIADRRARRRH